MTTCWALQHHVVLLLLSGATALQLPHAPSGLLAGRRGGALFPRREARGLGVGVQMNLVPTEENVESVLAECQTELGTLFGSNDQSQKVGITGVRRRRLQPTSHLAPRLHAT